MTLFRYLVCELKGLLIKNDIHRYLSATESSEFYDIIKFLKKPGKLMTIPYGFVNEYQNFYPEVFKDKKCGLFYVIDEGRKLYFSRKFRFKFHVQRYYRNLCIEQDERSPHCYLSDDFRIKQNSVIMDVGAAEGIFALRNSDKASEILLFECDKEWVEALEHTFEFCRDKVKIIIKSICDRDDQSNMTLDSIDSFGKPFFLKMDIEGMETIALENAMKFISNADSVDIAVCSYHKADDEENICRMFEGCETEKSDGYMLFYYDRNFSAPYVRRGVIRIKA